jgi:NhaP-type Na+/H+ or K+/H+ antiporter
MLLSALLLDPLSSYNLIIEASVILILSFAFGEISRLTNIPAVLLLIVLGIGLKFGLDFIGLDDINFFPYLEILGIVGLIMIVLEAALELELRRDKTIPILKALGIAFVGLMASTYFAAIVLNYFIPGMDMSRAWIYATPLSILSSAIIIPSVVGLKPKKKEFHVYESTFSDILGIMLFYFLTGQVDAAEHSSGLLGFSGNVLLTIVISLIASYLIVIIFQRIKSHVKLFLLIAVLLLLYALGKKMHLSSLIIILIFGLLIANMELFFQGPLKRFLNKEQAHDIYEGLHVVTMETAFVVRTFFFVIFGMTIVLSSLASVNVALVSLLIIASIYLIRWIILRVSLGPDIKPQLYIAPRGLITILLFYAIPTEIQVPGFNSGILLFIIIGTSIIMTIALIMDKRRTNAAINEAKARPVGYVRWKAPEIEG